MANNISVVGLKLSNTPHLSKNITLQKKKSSMGGGSEKKTQSLSPAQTEKCYW